MMWSMGCGDAMRTYVNVSLAICAFVVSAAALLLFISFAEPMPFDEKLHNRPILDRIGEKWLIANDPERLITRALRRLIISHYSLISLYILIHTACYTCTHRLALWISYGCFNHH